MIHTPAHHFRDSLLFLCRSLIFLTGLILIGLTAACNYPQKAAPTPLIASPISQASTSPTTPGLPSPQSPEPTASLLSQVSPSPTSPPAPTTAVEACIEDICSTTGTFLLVRPIGPNGRNTIDISNRFGEYSKRTKDVHHGVDFLNSSGMPVLAALDGEVTIAGDDSRTPFALRTNVYGNLVILQHSLPGQAEPLFTLYGHLSQVDVKAGETVKAGQQIGLVGMSGSVKGSTLHFEVRWGENSFAATRNPELWLAALPDEAGQPMGALAGRVLDAQGNPVQVRNIVIERLAGPGLPALDQYYIETYAEKRLLGLPPWEESFAIGDLPPGEYQISFWLSGMQQREVEVLPGKLTVVTFHIK